MDFELILSCLQRVWDWRLGPGTQTEWGLVLGHALAGMLAALIVRRAPFPAATRGRERVFWLLLALLLFAVALVRFFDLQTTITDTGRCIAREEGWYRGRRAFQAQVMTASLVVLAGLTLAFLWWMRRALWRNALALLGCLVLLVYGLIRVASLSHVDAALRREVFALRADRWIELTGIVLVVVGALWVLRRRLPRPQHR